MHLRAVLAWRWAEEGGEGAVQYEGGGDARPKHPPLYTPQSLAP